MGKGGGEGEIKLEYTPTWIVAVVCSVIVFISLVVERLLHFLGKLLSRKNQKPLFEALQKVKEVLMLLGFISLMLVAFHGLIQEICIPPSFTHSMLPCKKEDGSSGADGGGCWREELYSAVNGVSGGDHSRSSGGDHCRSNH